MVKRIVFVILFWIYFFPSIAQEKPSEAIPETQKALKKSASSADHASLLCKLALLYVYKPGEIPKDLDSALLLTKQAEVINSSLKDKAIEAKIYFIKANALREKGDTAQGHNAIKRSLEIYNIIPDLSEHGDAYIELSNYYNVHTKEGCIKRKECYEKALIQFRQQVLEKNRETH
jgi:tetratricopeptide (TPR) repeat protein